MDKGPKTYQVIIVGGGPVGLFLGICLEQTGISTIILEKRTKIRSGSRSLGIHPVSLELFNKHEIADAFVTAGIKVYQGHAFTNAKKIGTLSFEGCPRPYNFILTLPQNQTEAILEKKARQLNPKLMLRDTTVTNIHQSGDNIEVTFFKDGQEHTLKGSFLVGCDGKDSFVREQAGIPFEGKNYPDTYIMGDFEDNTSFGSDAAIFLCNDGLIESFPLINNRRRWVVKTESYFPKAERSDIEKRVARRIGHDLSETEHFMLSSFGVQKFTARPMVKGRIILTGDAAHVVSPIGGQGMNLGWLGAWDLTQSFISIFRDHKPYSEVITNYETRRQKAAQNATKRAEINMWLGRKSSFPFVRNSLVYLMLHKPLAPLMARIFTMRGIEQWMI